MKDTVGLGVFSPSLPQSFLKPENVFWEKFKELGFFQMSIQAWGVWTDGACEPNPGTGGWGFCAEKGSPDNLTRVAQMGGAPDTTNNRMEYEAAIQALLFFPASDYLIIHSDSQLLINTMTLWGPAWLKRGVVHKKKNADLVLTLFDLSSSRHVMWKWVRGHSGNLRNEAADSLAGMACRDSRSKAGAWREDAELIWARHETREDFDLPGWPTASRFFDATGRKVANT